MKVYHATDYNNLENIMVRGLQPSGEGIFFAEGFKQSLAFMIFRNYSRVLVLELEIDENALRESFDHSESLFCKMFGLESCKAWVYPNSIPAHELNLENARIYDMNRGK